MTEMTVNTTQIIRGIMVIPLISHTIRAPISISVPCPNPVLICSDNIGKNSPRFTKKQIEPIINDINPKTLFLRSFILRYYHSLTKCAR